MPLYPSRPFASDPAALFSSMILPGLPQIQNRSCPGIDRDPHERLVWDRRVRAHRFCLLDQKPVAGLEIELHDPAIRLVGSDLGGAPAE